MAIERPAPVHVQENKDLFHTLQGIGLVFTLLMFLGPALLGYWDTSFTLDHRIYHLGPVCVEIGLTYLWLSWKVVAPDSVGAAYFYGTALSRLASGPRFLPYGLIQLRTFSKNMKEFQCPGEPEKVYKGDDKDTLPDGMVRPIRVTTATQKKGDDPKSGSGGPLDTQMSMIVNFVFQYVVDNILDFIANFSGDFAEVEKQLRDIGEQRVGEIAAKNTPETFIEKLEEINGELGELVSERFERSGIKIISVRLISPDPSHGVSEALAKVPKARAEAQARIIEADATKVEKTKAGEGEAAARLAMLEAEAKGLKKMIQDLGVKGEAVLAAQTAGKLAENAGTIVVGTQSGMRDLMGTVKAAQATFTQQPKPKGGKP